MQKRPYLHSWEKNALYFGSLNPTLLTSNVLSMVVEPSTAKWLGC